MKPEPPTLTARVEAKLALSTEPTVIAPDRLRCPRCNSEIRVCYGRNSERWFGVHVNDQCPLAWNFTEPCDSAREAAKAAFQRIAEESF